MHGHRLVGEAAKDELVPVGDDGLLHRHHQLCIELVVEDAAADDVAVVEEADAVMRFGPWRLDQERALADLAADDPLGFEVLQRLDYSDQRELAELHDLVLRLDLGAGLHAVGFPTAEQHVPELQVAWRQVDTQVRTSRDS